MTGCVIRGLVACISGMQLNSQLKLLPSRRDPRRCSFVVSAPHNYHVCTLIRPRRRRRRCQSTCLRNVIRERPMDASGVGPGFARPAGIQRLASCTRRGFVLTLDLFHFIPGSQTYRVAFHAGAACAMYSTRNGSRVRTCGETFRLFLVICTRNRVPVSGSEIHYTVPK